MAFSSEVEALAEALLLAAADLRVVEVDALWVAADNVDNSLYIM